MPRISKEKLKKVRKIEFAINKNLFSICIAITLVAMIMALIEFFTRGAFLSSKMGLFYIGVLFIYSVHKEMLRWLEEKEIERRGEYFVYSWIGLTVILYITNFLTKDYFIYSSKGISLGTLNEIAVITLQVGAIFILSRLSKAIKIGLQKR